MATLASIFGFGPTTAQPPVNPNAPGVQGNAQPQVQYSPGNLPPQAPATQQTAPNSVTPGTATPQPDPNAPKPPLADYAKLWDTPTTTTDANQPLFNLDPAKMQESVSKMDFTKAINKDQLAAITAGGEGAVAALAQVINAVGQESFSQAAKFSAALVQSGHDKTKTSLLSELPGHIKQHAISNSMREANPLLNNPAVAPLVSALESQFSKQYPGASVKEINEHVTSYITGLNQVFNPVATPAGPGTTTNKAGETDWGKFLGT